MDPSLPTAHWLASGLFQFWPLKAPLQGTAPPCGRPIESRRSHSMEAPNTLDAARRQFQGDDYAVIPDIWTKDEVQQAIDALDALVDDIRAHPLRWQEHVVWQSDVPERQLTGIPQALRAAAATQPYIIGDLASHSAVLRRMILDERCRRMAEALLQTESVCHFSNATIRSANGGCACNWHRDWPNSYCTIPVASCAFSSAWTACRQNKAPPASSAAASIGTISSSTPGSRRSIHGMKQAMPSPVHPAASSCWDPVLSMVPATTFQPFPDATSSPNGAPRKTSSVHRSLKACWD